MKKLVRTPWVQSIIAWLASAYLGATLATIRWRFENRAPADAAVRAQPGLIALFWHGRIALAPVCRRVLGKKPRRVMISNSPDGELIAKVVARLGFPAIRGSSTTDSRRERRSVMASVDALKFIQRDGGAVVITPDGPRGPAQEMPIGPMMMAKMRGDPVFLLGFAATPSIRLGTWDQTRIPLPFGRGCVVFDGPVAAPRDADLQTLEALRCEWQDRLNAAQARAEALLEAR